ncbi:MAG: transketolase, partial [Candidatus Latescibacterota bacterium]
WVLFPLTPAFTFDFMDTSKFSALTRRIVLEQAKRAHVGHIGSALSIVEIVSVLYGCVIDVGDPDAQDRDRFVLSKGHAALALYAALHLKGFIDRSELDTYCGEGTLLGVHPEHQLNGVDFSTGSLGHGLSFAVGAALAARLDGSARRVYALLSDAECNEGSVWEASMFAAHHRLHQLTAIIDNNGQQALGKTADILTQTTAGERWRATGWHVIEADGHDVGALESAFAQARKETTSPSVIMAHTTAGKGVSFMEGLVEWHYMPMSDDHYQRALRELGDTL